MFLMLESNPDRRTHLSPKQQPLLDREANFVPRHDLRMPMPPRQVRLFIGEGLFCPDAPLL
ncbi:hypothetical protein [Geomonas propionica]|uniref:Uncharacterized protein n=1 Tax=Geomonas propionica TaxID=2798582 RepID=A0ABS0YS83_9BACT|nr:hypothetical protein [Geomonas propionica]MBJ6800390.1 hypothetical protein [Geomonas propionica]